MSKRNKFFAFLIFSAIILCVYVIYSRMSGISTNTRGSARNSIGEQALEAEFIYDAREKRNPFLPLVSPDGRILEPQVSKKRDGEIYLEGIIYDAGGSSYAVINGEVVRAGESSGTYQLIRIEPQKIIILREGKEMEIELKREE